MNIVKILMKIFLYVASLVTSILGLLQHFITIATNDPTDYQPVLLRSILFVVISLGAAIVFYIVQQSRLRLTILVPLVVDGYALYAVARFWPYAFP